MLLLSHYCTYRGPHSWVVQLVADTAGRAGWHSAVSQSCRTLIRSCSEHGTWWLRDSALEFIEDSVHKVLATGRAEQILELVDRNTSGRIRLSGLASLHMMRGAQEGLGRAGQG